MSVPQIAGRGGAGTAAVLPWPSPPPSPPPYDVSASALAAERAISRRTTCALNVRWVSRCLSSMSAVMGAGWRTGDGASCSGRSRCSGSSRCSRCSTASTSRAGALLFWTAAEPVSAFALMRCSSPCCCSFSAPARAEASSLSTTTKSLPHGLGARSDCGASRGSRPWNCLLNSSSRSMSSLCRLALPFSTISRNASRWRCLSASSSSFMRWRSSRSASMPPLTKALARRDSLGNTGDSSR